jgi:hypothetical protein
MRFYLRLAGFKIIVRVFRFECAWFYYNQSYIEFICLFDRNAMQENRQAKIQETATNREVKQSQSINSSDDGVGDLR